MMHMLMMKPTVHVYVEHRHNLAALRIELQR